MGKGATNKRKGSNAERYYAKVFREDLGFNFCKTSRQANRMLDDAGVDLAFLPFNVQIKAGYNSGLNEFKTLQIIRDRIPELFPPYDPIHKLPSVLIHKKDTGRGKKKSIYDELVFIKSDELFLFYNKGERIPVADMPYKTGQKRGWTFDEVLEISPPGMMLYRKDDEQLVVMTFEKFKELIQNKKWE